MSVKKKKIKFVSIIEELAMVEELVIKFGVMKTMSMLGYVSVAPLYTWRKNNSIPLWAKNKIIDVYKETKIESNKR